MNYSLFVGVCLIIHVLINVDIFRKKPTVNLPAIKPYRIFVASIAIYFLTDFLWGIFEELKLPIALTIDTTLYFISMGFSILAYTQYIVGFLKGRKWFCRTVLYVGNAFFLAGVVLLIINIFTPVLFTIDYETSTYTTYLGRNIMLYIQSIMYALLLIYSTVYAFKLTDSGRRKYITISLYSVVMFISIVFQIYNTHLPIYSMGCIVGSTLLNAFVINDIKEEYKKELEHTRIEIEEDKKQINETMQIAYTDPLTKVKNKHAYVEEEDRIDKLIAANEMEDFAVVVFDLNGLKIVNDTKGHDAGDVYIIDSCHVIEKYFGHDHLYRFGGDEFVVILTGEDYVNRSKSFNDFEHYIDKCLGTDKPIISSGMSKYRKGSDNTYHAVFYRADKIMYSRKDSLKEYRNN